MAKAAKKIKVPGEKKIKIKKGETVHVDAHEYIKKEMDKFKECPDSVVNNPKDFKTIGYACFVMIGEEWFKITKDVKIIQNDNVRYILKGKVVDKVTYEREQKIKLLLGI